MTNNKVYFFTDERGVKRITQLAKRRLWKLLGWVVATIGACSVLFGNLGIGAAFTAGVLTGALVTCTVRREG